MIHALERGAKDDPEGVFFRFADEGDGSGPAAAGDQGEAASGGRMLREFTYRQTRMRAIAIARSLEADGLAEGDLVGCDMDNCPAFVFLALACGYGGFILTALNHRLTADEKRSRLVDAGNARRQGHVPLLTEADVERRWEILDAKRTDLAAITHAGDRLGGAYLRKRPALVLFTSGTSGKPKAALLTGTNLCAAAEGSNTSLNARGQGLWQLALPMYHIGGFQIMVRSLLNGNPFILYRHFDAAALLDDALALEASHLSVVDKMLQDLLDEDEGREQRVLPRYACVLLGGAAPNKTMLERATRAHVSVIASYGMTETSSYVASAPAVSGFDGTLTLLPGYSAIVIAPDDDGFGKLAIKGPGVFAGYLTGRADMTADGYFMTGDTARVADRHIAVAERTGDLFVSGGENIYPAEIREKVLQLPGVRDAYVYGAVDATWGRRPVAFVEAPDIDSFGASSATAFAERIRTALQCRLARIYQPTRIFVLREFPRSGIGKIDRRALEALDAQALDVRRVDVYRIKQPFVTPIRTAQGLLRDRESLIVRVTDARGRTGIAEGTAFATPWYLPETIDDDERVLGQLIPQVLRESYLHPSEVHPALWERVRDARDHPMALAAIEPALWDLYGKIAGFSIRQLIAGRDVWDDEATTGRLAPGCVPGGGVVGIMGIDETVAAVGALSEAGYTRVKIKIRPKHDVARVEAVRNAFPRMAVMLDANQSYTEDDREALAALDALGAICIEEPLDPSFEPKIGPRGIFPRLARLQRSMRTPLCLDESVRTEDDLHAALTHPDLRCFAVKIGKFGGVKPAVDFIRDARSHGITVWMGGMFDTGVSKRLHAAFCLLPGLNIPGDISDTSRYFAEDICDPPFALDGGVLAVNPSGHAWGLGCELDDGVLDRVCIAHRAYEGR